MEKRLLTYWLFWLFLGLFPAYGKGAGCGPEELRSHLIEKVGELLKEDSRYDKTDNCQRDSLWKADMASGMPDSVLLRWVHRIGYLSVGRGMHVEITSLFSDALEYVSECPEPEKNRYSVSLKVGLGAIYEEMGLWTKAMNLYFEVLDMPADVRNGSQNGNVLNNIGNIYFKQGYYDKAKFYYDSAVSVYLDYGERKDLVNTYNNIAALYYTQEDYTHTTYYLNQALAQLNPEEEPDSYYVLLQNMAAVYNRQGKKDLARNFVREVIGYQEKEFRNFDLVHTYLLMSNFFDKKDIDSVGFYIGKAMEKADALGNPAAQISVLESLYTWNKAGGRYKKACSVLERLVKMQDSLAALDNRMRIESIEAANAIEQDNQNKDIALQKMQIEKLQIQKRELFLIIVLFFLLVVILVLFYHYNVQKQLKRKNEELSFRQKQLHEQEKRLMDQKEKELEEILELRNKELTSKVLNLVKNNGYITDITQELQKLLLELNPKDTAKKAHIREILVKLRNQGNEGTYSEFKYYFEQVHQSFYKNLSEAYPELTYKDIRLCSFLKLGLSSKEIASITFTEVRSVESARNRLRKKMNLDSDINLIEFFAKF